MKKRIAKKIEKKQNETFMFIMPNGGGYSLEILSRSACDLKRSARKKISTLYRHYGNVSAVASAISETKQRGHRPALLISHNSSEYATWYLIPERGFGSKETSKQFSARWQEFAERIKPYCNDDYSFQYCLR